MLTTGVVEWLTMQLGDDIDRSRCIFRDGRVMAPRREHGHCCWLPRDERTDT